MNANWITDRAPTKDDTSRNLDFYVWTIRNNEVTMWYFGDIDYGEPWMPIEPPEPPEPYVKPKRWRVNTATDGYYVYDCVTSTEVADSIPTLEAAERIAAIYEEVKP